MQVGSLKQWEAAVGRPTRGELELLGSDEPFLRTRTAPPDGKPFGRRIERKPAHADAVEHPEILVTLHRAGHDHSTAVGGHAGVAKTAVRVGEGTLSLAGPVHP